MADNQTPHVGSPLGAYPTIASSDSDTCNEDGISTDDLKELAGSAQSITVDGQSVTERSLTELIEMDKYLKQRAARCRNGGNGWNSVGVARAIPPDGSGRC